MPRLIVHLLINAVALWAAASLAPGIGFGDEPGSAMVVTVLGVALIFGLVNALIKPILAFVTCPFYVLSLGLFTFVVNAFMLLLTANISQRLDLTFVVDDFGSAIVGSVIVSIVSFVLNLFFGGDSKKKK